MRSSVMDWRVQGTLSPTDFIVQAYRGSQDVANSPNLGWLDRIIQRARAEGRLVSRADVRPRLIGPRALPTVVIIDVEEAPRRYRLRLVGTALVRLTGHDNTGRTFDELAEEHREANTFFIETLDATTGQRVSTGGETFFITVRGVASSLAMTAVTRTDNGGR